MGILFFILKLIGKILLIILLLILLIILLVLFVPFRYRIDINKEGPGGGGTATVSWLLKMIQVTVGADIGAETGFRIIKDVKLFGISLFDLLRKIKGGKKPPEPGPAAQPAAPAAAETVLPDAGAQPEMTGETAETDTAGESGTVFEETAEAEGTAEEPSEGPEARPEAESAPEETAEAEPSGTAEETEKPPEEPAPKTDPVEVVKVLGRQALAFIKSIPERILNFTLTNSYRIMELLVRLMFLLGTVIWQVFSLIFRLFGLPGQIESVRAAVVEKFWHIVRLIQKWTAFATDAQVHEAVGFLLDRVKKILGHVMPKKVSGHLEVGFSDPSVTGNVMAAYAAIYPLYLNDFELTPYFNETRFEGKADLRGRIYLFYLAYLAITTILNKNIKYVISYLKHMKEEDS